jgi:indolepyruvate ferredoxin oxidoreductase alpha subunit
LALQFLTGLDAVLVVEELDPVIEKALTYVAGKYHLPVTIHGKLDGALPSAGERSVDELLDVLPHYFGNTRCVAQTTEQNAMLASMQNEMQASLSVTQASVQDQSGSAESLPLPALPPRPPVLCAGCPHRASFYAVKHAVALVNSKHKATGSNPLTPIYCGDIGCYTLGNAAPLHTTDTCLCMGAGITMAQGLARVNENVVCFAFAGDSTFFASGMTGVVNAVYNGADVIVVILDNRLTAMTGGQPHPGIGKTIVGTPAPALSIEAILEAMGVNVAVINPLDLGAAIGATEAAIEQKGVRGIIFRAPCVSLVKGCTALAVEPSRCIGCTKCVNQLGCPALSMRDGKARVDASLCNGCSLCAQLCPVTAIS